MFGQPARARRFQIGVQNIGAGGGACRFIGINPAVLEQRVLIKRVVVGIGVQSSPS